MQNDGRLTLTIEEVAKILGISRGLAYDLAKRDRLPVPVIRCGRRLLISRKVLMDLIEGNGNKSGDITE